MPTKARRVAFFHLDLGVGGAEQLVLQTALQTHAVFEESWRLPCTVDVFTSYFDTDRCLEASRDREDHQNASSLFLPFRWTGAANEGRTSCRYIIRPRRAYAGGVEGGQGTTTNLFSHIL